MSSKQTHITKSSPVNVGKQRIELSDNYLHSKAKKALYTAKKLEQRAIAKGARYIRLDSRTMVLKNN